MHNRCVKLDIVMDGMVVKHFLSFSLKQHTKKHHQFELVLPYDALGEHENYNLEQLDKFIGRRITTIVAYKDESKNGPQRVFVGTMTSIAFLQENRSLGSIVIKGYSPTILMDGAPHIQSFAGEYPLNISTIANTCIEQCLGESKYDFRVQGHNNFQIPFSVQYDKTHYNYLARMAAVYGEQFYYDGEFLHFGKLPEQNSPLKLIYGSNMHDVNVEINAVHTKPSFYGYNSSRDQKLTTEQTPISHRGNLAKRAYYYNQQGDKYRNTAKKNAPIRAVTDIDVVYAQRNEAAWKAMEVFTVSGSTSLPFLYPGCIVDLIMKDNSKKKRDTAYFTRVVITDVEHNIDTKGYYQGSFKAVAADAGYLPKPEFYMPIAQSQIAKVVDNKDPENKGRVKVQFLWQTAQDTTDFIRVMTPDAGGTDQITQNRGYVAIPEIGDQVMVGFQHNHPDRPFVLGSMFHGNIALGGGVNNHMRSIQTKSGIKVLMNDDQKSVTIEDPSGNTYFMDGQGNITVTAPNDINFNAGQNLNISVGKNMNTTVGGNQTNTVSMGKEKFCCVLGYSILKNKNVLFHKKYISNGKSAKA